MSALAPAVEVSVRLSEEFRALVRSHRRPRALIEPQPERPQSPALPAIRPAAAVQAFAAEAATFGPVRLQRFGRRPLCFEGALAKRASTEASGSGPVWHELSAYLTEQPNRVVLAIAAQPRPGRELAMRPLALAEEAASAEDCLELLEAFDPADAAPAPFSEAGGSAQRLLETSARHLALLAEAREDYLAVVRVFCGPAHPIVERLERRFGLAREGMPS